MAQDGKQRWIEVSGAEGRDYSTARRANEAWLAGVKFKDNTTGLEVGVHDIGPGLNVAIRYKDGKKVTHAEMPAVINPSISESEAKAILENLSHEQAEEWKHESKPDEIEIDLTEWRHPGYQNLEWPHSPKQNPETD